MRVFFLLLALTACSSTSTNNVVEKEVPSGFGGAASTGGAAVSGTETSDAGGSGGGGGAVAATTDSVANTGTVDGSVVSSASSTTTGSGGSGTSATGSAGAASSSSSASATSTTGVVSACPEVSSCAGQPDCSVAFEDQASGGCNRGNFTCGDLVGLLIEDSKLNEFPCLNNDCSKAIADSGAYLSAHCSSGTTTTGGSTTGGAPMDLPGCELCNSDSPNNGAFCYWDSVDFPEGECVACESGWADCDGSDPEWTGWPGGETGCETRPTELNQYGQCGDCGPDPNTCVCDIDGVCAGGW